MHHTSQKDPFSDYADGMPGQWITDGVDVEIGAEGVAESSGIGVGGYGVEKGGMEDCGVGLSVWWVRGEEIKRCFEQLRRFFWRFASSFVLELNCADADGVDRWV